MYANPFDYKGMKIFVKPLNYDALNKQNLESFEQQRLVTMVNDADLSAEEKQRRFAEIFQNMTNYSVANIADSMRQNCYTRWQSSKQRTHINDFVKNNERQFYEALKNHIQEVAKSVPSKDVTTNCSECQNQYITPFTFDQSNFFAFAS